MAFPDYFPEDCPPEDAVPASGTAYRLVGSPIAVDDFLSVRQRYPKRSFSNPEKECKVHGLSVYRNIDHAQKTREIIPALRDRFIGVCTLRPEYGALKPTPSRITGLSHCTWWVAVGVEPWEFFQTLEEQ